MAEMKIKDASKKCVWKGEKMRKSKKILSMLVLICMVVALAVPQLAMADSGDITILYTNDIHTYIDNDEEAGESEPAKQGWDYAGVAALKKSFGANTILVDAGDHAQGTAYGSMDKGETIMKLMKAAGYDVATLGNHEFDYGMNQALNIAENSGFPYVSCNFYNERDGVRGENVLDSYIILERGGKKIAFIGVTTPEAFTKSTPSYFQDENGKYIYGISGGTDGKALYNDVQESIEDAEAAGADYIIALGHLGTDASSAPWRSTDVIANTEGLDAFIDGHSHSEIEGDRIKDKSGAEVLLTQTGSYFNNVGKLTISDNGTITAELLNDGSIVTADPDVALIESSWINDIEDKLGEVVGYAKVIFDNYDKDGKRLVRSQSTNTGDFSADALYYLFDNMDLDVDVAVMNGGGIRNGAITGELSYKSCKEIHTFGNVACLQEVTGQQILDALEWGAKDCGTAESGGFLHVSGMRYSIDTTVKSTVQKDEKGVWTGGPTGEYRVKNVEIYNKDTGKYEPINPDGKYNLAGYNYTLRDLGDGFAMFAGAKNILDYVKEDYMVLADYIKAFPKDAATGLPTITAENSPYGDVNGSGRITVLTEEDTGNHDDGEQDTDDSQTGVPGEQKPDGEKPGTGDSDKNDAPKTGDESNFEFWIFGALMAACCLTVCASRIKNEKR